jgi:phosphoglycerate dehydrogenase-like enzyme
MIMSERERMPPFPARKDTNVLFAHVAYEFTDPFTARKTGMSFDIARNYDELLAKLPNADVLSVSMMWKNELAAKNPRLKFIQSISAGTDQYDREVLKANGIRLASGHGVNANAVAEHAISPWRAFASYITTASFRVRGSTRSPNLVASTSFTETEPPA